MLKTMKFELFGVHLWGEEHTSNTVITWDITYCGFTEFLCCHFIGNVCSHQHTDVYSHLLSNNVRDQFQSLWAFIYSLQPTLNAITKEAFIRHGREESTAQLFLSMGSVPRPVLIKMKNFLLCCHTSKTPATATCPSTLRVRTKLPTGGWW